MPRIAIAGPSELTVAAGSRAASMGGSLTDVVVAAALTATCTDPGICAPGGGGYIIVDVPGQEMVVIDGYMAFPGIGFAGEPFIRTVSMEYGGGVTTHVDAGSVAVPGAFAAFEMASKRYGSMPWRDLMYLVADQVEGGFPLSAAAHTYLLDAGEPIFSQDPVSREALFDGGFLRRHGDNVVFADLPPTLRLIGDEGAKTLYGGDLGKAIADDVRERGGRLTHQDLSSYRAVARAPLRADLSGWHIFTNPPPAVGGGAVLAALGEIAGADEPGAPETWFRSLRDVFISRIRDIEPARDRAVALADLLKRSGLGSPSTIAVAGVGADGGAVAASFSAGYGSGVIPTGTGMLMNNSVGEVELVPGGVENHTPGARMLSNMAPTVARSDRGLVAVASPGADRITSALTMTLARVALFGDNLTQAIDHPRLHPEFAGSLIRVAVEPGLDTTRMGVEVREYGSRHMYFGGVAGAGRFESGPVAYADPRRVGAVALID